MNTKADILSQIDNTNEENAKRLEVLKVELFALYDKDETLMKFFNKVECCDAPENYEFDECGMLISTYDLPFNLDAYPYFSEYIEGQMVGYFNENEKRMEVCHGAPITVNWNHSNREYFIFDHDTNKSICDHHDTELPEEYYHALIEQHQRKAGVFSDVVTVDYYGGYVAHVNTDMGNLTDSEVIEIIGKYENNE